MQPKPRVEPKHYCVGGKNSQLASKWLFWTLALDICIWRRWSKIFISWIPRRNLWQQVSTDYLGVNGMAHCSPCSVKSLWLFESPEKGEPRVFAVFTYYVKTTFMLHSKQYPCVLKHGKCIASLFSPIQSSEKERQTGQSTLSQGFEQGLSELLRSLTLT